MAKEDFRWPRPAETDLGRLPAQLDLNDLEVARAARPDEALWATLARLGWVPPSTAARMRETIHQLQQQLKKEGTP